MELFLLVAANILSFHLRPSSAIPIPLSTANCNFPAPVVPSLSGRIYSCTSAELEHQRKADYDAEARQWLKEANVVSLQHDAANAVPDYPNPSALKTSMSSSPSSSSWEPSDHDEGLPSLFDLFTNGAAHALRQRRPDLPGAVDSASHAEVKISLFDLPSARQSVHQHASTFGRKGKEVLRTVAHATKYGTSEARSTISHTVKAVLVFVVLGVLLAVGFTIRTGELLLRLGRSAFSSSSRSTSLAGHGSSDQAPGKKTRKRVRSSFEFFKWREAEAKGSAEAHAVAEPPRYHECLEKEAERMY